ncbi:MAG: hypothetical protein NC340_10345 [Ruminococcus flavefaciens]|nr:hypothetical protein [Ruminococcus flavefaciens]MCM1230972.1 hypothetical protein [Ruminococcus flavefaciens]
MKNENNREVEELLKNKMNELSDCVDCFDRISARAFPEKDEDFSESGFTVSDLENVTGRARRTNFIRWTAVTAAAVIGIAVIPRTALFNNVMSNIGSGSVRKNYENIIDEINAETQNGDYIIADYPLDYYIQNDLLVTPLFACPFEDCGKENAVVRIYIRQINGMMTNQVYAVEYEGTYSEENILAVAESEYKFSAEDIEEAEKCTFAVNSDSDSAVGQNFATDSDGIFIDGDGDNVSLASFQNFTVMKYDGGIIPITTEILYGHKTLTDDLYFYDVISKSNNQKIQLPEREKMWAKSVYFNGNEAMPEENGSVFTRTELFHSNSDSAETECMFIAPFEADYLTEITETGTDEIISLYADGTEKRLSTIILPTDMSALLSTKLYFSPEALDGETFINAVTSSENYENSLSYDISAEYNQRIIEENMQALEEALRQEEQHYRTLATEQNPLSSAE